MGLDVYVTDKRTGANLDLPPANGHDLFRIGYWRSSYNQAGINRVLDMATGMTLWDVLSQDEYVSAQKFAEVEDPNWAMMLIRAKSLRAVFGVWVSRHGSLDVDEVWIREDKEAVSDAQMALETYLRDAAAMPKGWGGQATEHGHTIAKSKARRLLGVYPNLEKRSLFLVMETNPGKWQWYLGALDVVIETIEWVLEHGDTTWSMIWSY